MNSRPGPRTRQGIAARRIRAACCLAALLVAAGVRAEDVAGPPPHDAAAANVIKLPYAFYNEMFGAAGAFVYAREGFPQERSQFLATAMVGTAGSGMVYA